MQLTTITMIGVAAIMLVALAVGYWFWTNAYNHAEEEDVREKDRRRV